MIMEAKMLRDAASPPRYWYRNIVSYILFHVIVIALQQPL